jgi:hypothetical protein
MQAGNRRGSSRAVEIDESAVRELAYQLWILRARPCGSPEVDWYRAEEELESVVAREETARARINGPSSRHR